MKKWIDNILRKMLSMLPEEMKPVKEITKYVYTIDKKNIRYSPQAIIMLKNMPDFKKDEFENWFFSRLVIGSNNILEYLISIETLKQAMKSRLITKVTPEIKSKLKLN